jgi:hypothetical protein
VKVFGVEVEESSRRGTSSVSGFIRRSKIIFLFFLFLKDPKVWKIVYLKLKKIIGRAPGAQLFFFNFFH